MLVRKRLAVVLGVAIATTLLGGRAAEAQELCFTTPASVPGLPGAPDWHSGTATASDALSDPRWAAGFWRQFIAGGLGDLDAGYRMIYDPSSHELLVSVQVLNDAGSETSLNDEVFFGITTGASANARAVRIHPGDFGALPASETAGATAHFRRMEYNSVSWSYLAGEDLVPGTTPPSWMLTPYVWRGGSTADWAVNFRVDLAALGVADATTDFRAAVGVFIQNEATAMGIAGWFPEGDATPPPEFASFSALYSGTSGDPNNPSAYALVDGAGTSCPNTVEIDKYAFGTTNVDSMGDPVPNTIDIGVGDVNGFFAQPDYSSFTPFAGQLEANFRIANWGSVADPAAAWPVIPNGEWVDNGENGAPVTEFAFDCEANTATQICGLDLETSIHQCVQIELRARPGAGSPDLTFNPATQYRNTRFEDLSTLRDVAVINVQGLQARLGNAQDRDVYIQVRARNMPAPGGQPVELPRRQMLATRRHVEKRPSGRKPDPDEPDGEQGRAGALKAGATAAAVAPPRQQAATTPALTPDQLLNHYWPTLEFHVYYSLGKRHHDNGEEYELLHAMYPFRYRLDHEGALYGFDHLLAALDGVALEPVAPDFYHVVVDNESEVRVLVEVRAHEEAGCHGSCPPPTIINKVIVKPGCHCGVVGGGASDGVAPVAAASFAALVPLAYWRRRKRRRPRR